jgi:hypothetical protein
MLDVDKLLMWHPAAAEAAKPRGGGVVDTAGWWLMRPACCCLSVFHRNPTTRPGRRLPRTPTTTPPTNPTASHAALLLLLLLPLLPLAVGLTALVWRAPTPPTGNPYDVPTATVTTPACGGKTRCARCSLPRPLRAFTGAVPPPPGGPSPSSGRAAVDGHDGCQNEQQHAAVVGGQWQQ